MEVPDGGIRHQQSMLEIDVFPRLRRPVDRLLHPVSVLRVNALEDTFDGRYGRAVVLEDSKVSSDPMISPVDGFHPKLPVWLRRCASARYASLGCSARRRAQGIADSVGRDRLSSAGVRSGTLAPRPRSSWAALPIGRWM